MEKKMPRCVDCPASTCYFHIFDNVPSWCPSVTGDDLVQESERVLEADDGMTRAALEASRVEGEGYGGWTRVEEIVQFAKRMEFKRIGIAFCVGLKSEARAFSRILKSNGFEVVSVCCKVGGLSKEKLGIRDQEKIRPGTYEAYCNPVAQALILDSAGCQLNVLVGLCVGHDSLFIKTTTVLTTALVAKDRVTGHNPAAVLYTSSSYYSRLLGGSETE